MIERYTLPEMGALWSERNKFQKWLDVETAVCEVHAEMGTIPAAAVEEIKARASFTVERIREIEKTTDHDVIAFTTALAEKIGEAARFVHYGLTSSDVVDTANALLLRDACDLLLRKIDALREVLKRRAFEFKRTPQIGRTHGIHAEPTSFGMTFALWYDEMRRNRERLGRVESRALAKGHEQQSASPPLSGHALELFYSTRFERGSATERFTLLERGGEWLLAGYTVSSDVLK